MIEASVLKIKTVRQIKISRYVVFYPPPGKNSSNLFLLMK